MTDDGKDVFFRRRRRRHGEGKKIKDAGFFVVGHQCRQAGGACVD